MDYVEANLVPSSSPGGPLLAAQLSSHGGLRSIAFAETMLANKFRMVAFDRDAVRAESLEPKGAPVANREGRDGSALGLLAAADAGLWTSLPIAAWKP